MKLPNADRAVVDLEKLENYCLSATHPRGKHKARVFASALKITDADSELLRIALLKAVQSEEARPAESDAYGRRYLIDFSMEHGGNTAMIRSSWIIRSREDFPRFVTCYVL